MRQRPRLVVPLEERVEGRSCSLALLLAQVDPRSQIAEHLSRTLACGCRREHGAGAQRVPLPVLEQHTTAMLAARSRSQDEARLLRVLHVDVRIVEVRRAEAAEHGPEPAPHGRLRSTVRAVHPGEPTSLGQRFEHEPLPPASLQRGAGGAHGLRALARGITCVHERARVPADGAVVLRVVGMEQAEDRRSFPLQRRFPAPFPRNRLPDRDRSSKAGQSPRRTVETRPRTYRKQPSLTTATIAADDTYALRFLQALAALTRPVPRRRRDVGSGMGVPGVGGV
jgi:hypothetical protein